MIFRNVILSLFCSLILFPCFSQRMQSTRWLTPFERDTNTTATYQEAISFYKDLASNFPQLKILEYGKTDSGFPLHLVVLSTDEDFERTSIREKGKTVLMINNAIHPGEPCGVDASMMLVRDYLQDQQKMQRLKNTVVIVIPFYNIGGGLNRNSTSRTNQNGPAAYGFRGNARNLDLNRDFIKCDTKNAQTFNQIFGIWQPDVFIDNHTSNGADYQYTMTLIPTQHNKLPLALSEHLQEKMLPQLYQDMEREGWEMTPYVYAQDTPDGGIAGFLDLPRYSSGYAALFNALSFMPETHMLKPFKDRVYSTYAFSDVMINYMSQNGEAIKAAKHLAERQVKEQTTFAIDWVLDREVVEQIKFKGYTAKYKPSEVSGIDRLYYDRNDPYEKEIPFLNTYKVKQSITKPTAYILPQAYGEIIERMEWNGVAIERLSKDQELELEFYRIQDFKTRDYPYEAHYLHSSVAIEKITQRWKFYKGDYVIYTNQNVNRYIIETLEPQAPDSWFAWNFFDGILAQKEYFSSYVFEDLAAAYLKSDPTLRTALEKEKTENPGMREDARAQLNFIYQNSPHYESTHRLYPVGRVLKAQPILTDK